MVRAIFETGQAAVGNALRTVVGRVHSDWLRRAGVHSDRLVKDLDPGEWVELFLSRPIDRRRVPSRVPRAQR
jgi:hypothetical protein